MDYKAAAELLKKQDRILILTHRRPDGDTIGCAAGLCAALREQGKTACIRIPLGRGVCGTAAEQGRTQLVENVHDFPGHIACDSASNSEIVVPLYKDGALWGVLDLDSPYVGRFAEADRQGLEKTAQRIQTFL